MHNSNVTASATLAAREDLAEGFLMDPTPQNSRIATALLGDFNDFIVCDFIAVRRAIQDVLECTDGDDTPPTLRASYVALQPFFGTNG